MRLALAIPVLALVACACRVAAVAEAPDQAALLGQARREWSTRRDEQSAVWVGRRLAYLGRTEEAANILYHLALAQYLQGAFDAARESWERT